MFESQFGNGNAISNRLEWHCHELETEHIANSRVYVGRDFYGAGHPNDTCLLGNDYCVPWMLDNRVIIHILDDKKTQVYSTVLSVGPVVKTVITGMYKLTAHDWESDAEAKKQIELHIENEKRLGPKPFLLPARVGNNGKWVGKVRVFNGWQTEVGHTSAPTTITITHHPLDHFSSKQTFQIQGHINRQLSYTRRRHVNEHYYEGPDLYGNGQCFGRAVFSVCYIRGEDYRWKCREFLIDPDNFTLSVVYEFINNEVLEYVIYGVLEWKKD